MIVLNATTMTLQAVLSAAPATNQLPCSAAYADQAASIGSNDALTNGTTAITLVAAPASGVARVINSVSIYNADTAAVTVTVEKNDNGTLYPQIKVTIPSGYRLGYNAARGWGVTDTNGNFLETVQSEQAGTWAVNVSNFPATQGVNLTELDGSALAGPTSWGSAPSAGAQVQNVNAYIVSGGSGGGNVNVTEWNTVGLGSPTAWGSAPSGDVIGVNANILNASLAVTQSGTWTVQQGSAPWSIQGDASSGASNAGNPVKIGGAFNTTQPTVTTGQAVDAQMTARGAQIVATGADTFNVTINGALPTGGNALGSVSVSNFPASQAVSGTVTANAGTGTFTVADSNFQAQGSTTSGQKGLLVQGAVTTSPPSYTTAQSSPLSLDTSGALRISDSGIAQNLMTTNLSALGTTTFGASSAKFLNLINVTYAAYTNTGSLTVSIQDGSGNVLYSFLTGAIGTSTTIYNYIAFSPLCLPMNNGANPPKVVLSGTALSTGYIALTLGWQ